MIGFWNRRPRQQKNNRLLHIAVLLTGSMALGVSMLLFARVFGASSAVFAATTTVLVAAWTGMLHTVFPLYLPAAIREVGRSELRFLRWRWSGVAGFGVLLRKTPLRHLGGPVFLATCDHASDRVLRGIQEAEAIHVWSVLFCAPWVMFWFWQEMWLSVAASVAVHSLINIYPILHLRMSCGRLERVTARFGHRKLEGLKEREQWVEGHI